MYPAAFTPNGSYLTDEISWLIFCFPVIDSLFWIAKQLLPKSQRSATKFATGFLMIINYLMDYGLSCNARKFVNQGGVKTDV